MGRVRERTAHGMHWRRNRGGGRETRPPVEKISGRRPPEIMIFKFFYDTYCNFAFFNIFKIKWSKSP